MAAENSQRGVGASSGRGVGQRRDRAQTTLDFAVAISLFIVVLLSAIAMIPSLFAPFDDSGSRNGMVADRVGDRLSNGLLATEPGETAKLDVDCTTGFFDADGTVPSDCRYDADADSLATAVGVLPYRNVNVTIENESGIQSLRGTRLAAGSTPTEAAGASVARRIVLVDGRTLRLYVRVW